MMSLALSELNIKPAKVTALKTKNPREPVKTTLSDERKAELDARYLKLKPILDAMPLD